MNIKKGTTATIKTLKEKRGTPKTEKATYRTTDTFKAGKSFVEYTPYVGSEGVSIVISAKDKNARVNGVYVGMKKVLL